MSRRPGGIAGHQESSVDQERPIGPILKRIQHVLGDDCRDIPCPKRLRPAASLA